MNINKSDNQTILYSMRKHVQMLLAHCISGDGNIQYKLYINF